jgi:hypothetical protein
MTDPELTRNVVRTQATREYSVADDPLRVRREPGVTQVPALATLCREKS